MQDTGATPILSWDGQAIASDLVANLGESPHSTAFMSEADRFCKLRMKAINGTVCDTERSTNDPTHQPTQHPSAPNPTSRRLCFFGSQEILFTRQNDASLVAKLSDELAPCFPLAALFVMGIVQGNAKRTVVVRIEPSGHLRTWPSQTDRSKSQLIKLSSVYFKPAVAPGMHTVGETKPPSCRPVCFPALENEQDSDAEFSCVKMCTPLDQKSDELHCNCKMIKTISCS